jgi:hypothetical protein
VLITPVSPLPGPTGSGAASPAVETVYGDSRRMIPAVAGALPLAMLRIPTSPPKPSGLVAGSGSATGTGGLFAPIRRAQARPPLPTRVAVRWSRASTTGVVATETPSAGTPNAPAERARRSHRVDSGTHTSGAGEAVSASSTAGPALELADFAPDGLAEADPEAVTFAPGAVRATARSTSDDSRSSTTRSRQESRAVRRAAISRTGGAMLGAAATRRAVRSRHGGSLRVRSIYVNPDHPARTAISVMLSIVTGQNSGRERRLPSLTRLLPM